MVRNQFILASVLVALPTFGAPKPKSVPSPCLGPLRQLVFSFSDAATELVSLIQVTKTETIFSVANRSDPESPILSASLDPFSKTLRIGIGEKNGVTESEMGDYIDQLFGHFGEGVAAIQDSWDIRAVDDYRREADRDLKQFNQLLQSGNSLEAAVWQTRMGKIAKSRGFTRYRILPSSIQSRGRYSRVDIRFRK